MTIIKEIDMPEDSEFRYSGEKIYRLVISPADPKSHNFIEPNTFGHATGHLESYTKQYNWYVTNIFDSIDSNRFRKELHNSIMLADDHLNTDLKNVPQSTGVLVGKLIQTNTTYSSTPALTQSIVSTLNKCIADNPDLFSIIINFKYKEPLHF